MEKNRQTDDNELDLMLEAAVREKGAIEHLRELEAGSSDNRVVPMGRWMKILSWSVAASLSIVACAGLKLDHDVREAGYAFDPVAGQRSGSSITALMNDRQIKEALKAIESARSSVNEQLEFPSTDDPEYTLQLKADSEELDFLAAVCHMRQGKYFRSKRELKAVRDGGGAFASDAEKLLDSI
mgnify:CR=1 FL=1